jgi:transmembrane sensor
VIVTGKDCVPKGGSDRWEQEGLPSEAAAWQVRLESPDAAESDFTAFEAWLARPGAREAFERIEALTGYITAHREYIGRAMTSLDDTRSAQEASLAKRRESRRQFFIRAASAGALAAAVVGGVVLPPQLGWALFTTAKGENRTVTLSDGTIVRLNSGSKLKVKIAGGERRVVMGEGEASFAVAHDPRRPFIVSVGDHQVSVLGTEFNILNTAQRVEVTVRQGIVQVHSGSPSAFESARLTAGDQLTIGDGQVVRRMNAAERAFAWQSGLLVYDGATLADLVSDLNRYFPQPVRVEGAEAAALKFSGVLAFDDRRQVVRRLEAFLPIEAASVDGVLVLRKRADATAP